MFSDKKKIYVFNENASRIKKLSAKLVYGRSAYTLRVNGSLSIEGLSKATGLSSKTVKAAMEHLKELGLWSDGAPQKGEGFTPRKNDKANHWSERLSYWVCLVRAPGDNPLSVATVSLYSLIMELATKAHKKRICPAYLAKCLSVSRTTIYESLNTLQKLRFLKWSSKPFNIILKPESELTETQLSYFSDRKTIEQAANLSIGSFSTDEATALEDQQKALKHLLISNGVSEKDIEGFNQITHPDVMDLIISKLEGRDRDKALNVEKWIDWSLKHQNDANKRVAEDIA